MERIAEKLKSKSGVSVVLAMVFLLLCVMVGASVLVAAASNAGRTRSNRQEQQLYLTLSSALQLITEDLTADDTVYTGSYICKKETVSPPGGGGSPSNKYTFAPASGTMTGKFSAVFSPFLEQIFKADIGKKVAALPVGPSDQLDNGFAGGPDPQDQTFTLTVVPEEPLEDYEVRIDVTITTGYRIRLDAVLKKAPEDYAVELYKNYHLTTELTRSNPLASVTLPSGTEETTVTWEQRWKPGHIISSYKEAP